MVDGVITEGIELFRLSCVIDRRVPGLMGDAEVGADVAGLPRRERRFAS